MADREGEDRRASSEQPRHRGFHYEPVETPDRVLLSPLAEKIRQGVYVAADIDFIAEIEFFERFEEYVHVDEVIGIAHAIAEIVSAGEWPAWNPERE